MEEQKANVSMMQHMLHRINEFFDENKVEEIKDDEELGRRFSQFLREKERPEPTIHKGPDGLRMEVMETSEVIDEHGTTLAFLKLVRSGTVHLLWSPIPFPAPCPCPTACAR